METDNLSLWRRIERFELDDPDAALTFTQRLARENGWSTAFARRVVEEYKRFAFLAMTAGHEVTPSDEVDQAWHLHLTYTRSYWDEFCGEVLGRPLHHGPTKGGRREGERFEDQYERTIVSYRDAFGEAPPADVWPPSSVRFGEAAAFVRINERRAWVVRKPWMPTRAAVSLAGGLLLIPPLAASDSKSLGLFLLIGFLAFVFLASISAAMRHGNGGGSSKNGGGGWFGCGGGSDGGADGGGGCGGGGCGGGGCGGCGG